MKCPNCGAESLPVWGNPLRGWPSCGRIVGFHQALANALFPVQPMPLPPGLIFYTPTKEIPMPLTLSETIQALVERFDQLNLIRDLLEHGKSNIDLSIKTNGGVVSLRHCNGSDLGVKFNLDGTWIPSSVNPQEILSDVEAEIRGTGSRLAELRARAQAKVDTLQKALDLVDQAKESDSEKPKAQETTVVFDPEVQAALLKGNH